MDTIVSLRVVTDSSIQIARKNVISCSCSSVAPTTEFFFIKPPGCSGQASWVWLAFVAARLNQDMNMGGAAVAAHVSQNFRENRIRTDQNLPFISAPTPLPAVAWLFCSGLMGLIDFRRRTRMEYL